MPGICRLGGRVYAVEAPCCCQRLTDMGLVTMLKFYKKLATRGDPRKGIDCTHFAFDSELWEPRQQPHLEQLPHMMGQVGKDRHEPQTASCPDIS